MDSETKISLTTPRPPRSQSVVRPPFVRFEADEADTVPDLLDNRRVIKKRRATISRIAFRGFHHRTFATAQENPSIALACWSKFKENPDIPKLQELSGRKHSEYVSRKLENIEY